MAEAAEPPKTDLRGLRGLRLLLRSQRALVFISAASSVLATALGLVPFFCVAKMATAIYAAPPRLGEVRDLTFVALGAVAARYLAASLSTMVAHVAAFRVLHDLRLRIANKLGDVPLAFFATRTGGEIKRTMMDDVDQIESFVAHHFPDAAAAVAVPIVTAIALLGVDWRMALASIAMAPLAFAAMAVAMRDLDAAHKKWFELQDRTNNSVLEYFRGIHVIKTFGLTAKTFGDLSRSIEDGLAWMVGFMRTNGRGYGVFGALIGSSLVVLMPIGGWLHLRGSLSLGDLVLFLILGPQLLTSLLRLMFAFGNVQRIEEGNARITSILMSPDLAGPSANAQPPRDDGIVFRDVRFRYDEGSKEALAGVTFDMRAGTVTALVGPSGAGKTTIARLVPRLWEPSGGMISIGGVDIRDIPLDVLLGRISVVFQDVFLFHGTVRENLLLAKRDATDEELQRACAAARADTFIRGLPNGYETLLGERGTRLSGGEKQRLSIARALLKDAPILILDEATAFADAENEALIQEALAELCRQRTVLVIAHRLSTIASADQIVVLRDGRVEDRGEHAELIERCSLYHAMWGDHSASLDWALDAHSSEPIVEVVS
ncbi:MAG: ABC transporter ATP-binding protein [Polyangiaceae bacterium]|nr:ABC transporter ATP-binding protein [Polyangiaceae bacterium]